eukprot:m.972733 g.972733  ORF g.972733 m.972733 type:complete len:357 (+) comp23930_c0_seq30:279-1349(+)
MPIAWCSTCRSTAFSVSFAAVLIASGYAAIDVDNSSPEHIPAAVSVRSPSGGSVNLPMVGFGTAAKMEHGHIFSALHAGYRLIDSAQADEWYTEDAAGSALTEFLATAPDGVNRSSVFITTKVHPRNHGTAAAAASVERSLVKLQTDYIDLVLLHYPHCWPQLCGSDHVAQGTFHDSWVGLERLVEQGKIRLLGVSNFRILELNALIAQARTPPAVVQNWMDPFHQDRDVLAWCRDHAVHYQAYSSLGGQWGHRANGQRFGANPVMGHPTITRIAKEKGWTNARVVLTWQLQQGISVVPRTKTLAKLCDNALVFGGCAHGGNSGPTGALFELGGQLSADEINQINGLDGAMDRAEL